VAIACLGGPSFKVFTPAREWGMSGERSPYASALGCRHGELRAPGERDRHVERTWSSCPCPVAAVADGIGGPTSATPNPTSSRAIRAPGQAVKGMRPVIEGVGANGGEGGTP